jgi:hypothetical protein
VTQAATSKVGSRHRMGVCTLAVWREIASAEWAGLSEGAAIIKLQSRFESGPVRESIKTLRGAGYVQYVGTPAFGSYVASPNKCPLGECRPAFLDTPKPVAPPVNGVPLNSVFSLPEATDSRWGRGDLPSRASVSQTFTKRLPIARAGRTAAKTVIAFSSDGVLQIDARDGQRVLLGLDVTRDLFEWLQRMDVGNLADALPKDPTPCA